MYEHGAQNILRRRPMVKWLVISIAVLAFCVVGVSGYKYITTSDTIEEQVVHRVTFDSSISSVEERIISEEISRKFVAINHDYSVKAIMSGPALVAQDQVINAYVPVTSYGAVRQKISKSDLRGLTVLAPDTMSDNIRLALSDSIGVGLAAGDISSLGPTDVAFIAVEDLNSTYKLLEYEGFYYLDEFDSGAEFRSVVFEGADSSVFSDLEFSNLASQETTYKVNMTGVTALTRGMQRKLTTVQDPLYFSEKIGEFLADADLTHVSNEVSFKPNCSYSNTLFCSSPEFIETLRDSGVDLVEITGNHNNDLGSIYNTETIELYESLGWDIVGGGLSAAAAALPVVKVQKGSNVVFLAYNFPDSPNGGAIAGPDKAGANSFDLARIEDDITAAKLESGFVIVNVQYWECYAYPDGYLEFPQCDKPIGEQEADFKKIIDLGADMVVGSSAHQPQTYELYKGKPIYYGLGNLYFDQTQWPGTERGIVLTHYFIDSTLVQTKLTPTVYDRDLQTRVMTEAETEYLLQRLSDAR